MGPGGRGGDGRGAGRGGGRGGAGGRGGGIPAAGRGGAGSNPFAQPPSQLPPGFNFQQLFGSGGGGSLFGGGQ